LKEDVWIVSSKFWGSASSRRTRIITIVIFFLFAILVTIVGVLLPLSAQEATNEDNQLNQIQQQIQSMDLLHETAAIFQNNFEICLLMFIPVAGLVLGSIALFNTGSYIQAETIVENTTKGYNIPAILALFALFIFPFSWLEFISYSTAFSETFWFLKRGLEGKWRREIVNLFKLVLITAVLLAAGAFIEALLLSILG